MKLCQAQRFLSNTNCFKRGHSACKGFAVNLRQLRSGLLLSNGYIKGVIWLSMAAWLAVEIVLSPTRGLAQSPLRVGMMGDSGLEEYQGSDNRGGTYHDVSFNWVELLARDRGIYLGEWGDYSEPRRTGYAYNWARTGATAASLIAQGQHTGLAAQVAAGEIDVVVISIGLNDFVPYKEDGYEPIYSGQVSGAALTTRIDTLVANVTAAIDTIRQANPDIPIIMATIPDINVSPAVFNDARFSDPDKRQRVSDAVGAANTGLVEMAESRGLVVLDMNAMYSQLVERMVDGRLVLDGVEITMLAVGDEPHNGVLGDSIHGGTVLEGFLANQYIEALNDATGAQLSPLSDEEILANAGLISSSTQTSGTVDVPSTLWFLRFLETTNWKSIR